MAFLPIVSVLSRISYISGHHYHNNSTILLSPVLPLQVVLAVILALCAHQAYGIYGFSDCARVRAFGYELYSLKLLNTFDVVKARDYVFSSYHKLVTTVCGNLPLSGMPDPDDAFDPAEHVPLLNLPLLDLRVSSG